MPKALPLAEFTGPPRNGLMSSAALQTRKCSEEIWKGDEQLGGSNKRKLEIRCPRRKQARSGRERRMLLEVRDEGRQSQHCRDRHLYL